MILNQFDGNKKHPSYESYDPKLGINHIYIYIYTQVTCDIYYRVI